MAKDGFPLGFICFLHETQFSSVVQYCRNRVFEVEIQHLCINMFDYKEFAQLREFCIPLCVKVYIISEVGAVGPKYSFLRP